MRPVFRFCFNCLNNIVELPTSIKPLQLQKLRSPLSFVSVLNSGLGVKERIPLLPVKQLQCVESKASIESTKLLYDVASALNLLPIRFRDKIWNHPNILQLTEVVMDSNRTPLARFGGTGDQDFALFDELVTDEDISTVTRQIGRFRTDNRSGIDGTLHRICCMRDEENRIYALTIRIGRSVVLETAELVKEPLREGKSILLLGPPGVGKTTAVRNICRLLSDECKKRVVIVDTSNEIAGFGIAPHPSVGASRRMKMTSRHEQHQKMVEAVQNHTPEAIVIDEIGLKDECDAAKSISQRGVQLVATAHAQTLEQLIKDPVTQKLVGGVVNVVVGDKRQKDLNLLKKTVPERGYQSSFDVVVEMAERARWRIHYNANDAVDAILGGLSPEAELRYLDEDGKMVVRQEDDDEDKKIIAAALTEGTRSTSERESQVLSANNSMPSPLPDSSSQEAATKKPKPVNNKSAASSTKGKVKGRSGEAQRVLSANSDHKILQVNSTTTKKQLREKFNASFSILKKTENEPTEVREARVALQDAYRRILGNW